MRSQQSPTADAWAKVAPFVTTAEKQAICDCVELAKIRRIACPSKSGIVTAIAGIVATSAWAMGMIPFAEIGIDELRGQRLSMLALQGLNVKLKRDSP